MATVMGDVGFGGGAATRIELQRSAQALRVTALMADAAVTLPALWLRERADSTDQLDAVTRQRLINSHEFPDDLSVVDGEFSETDLFLRFSDGYAGRYAIATLLAELNAPPLLPGKLEWRADLQPVPYYHWPTLSEPTALLQAVAAYLQHGFLILRDTPIKPDSIREIAARFGVIRCTNFGEYFEVYSRPGSNDLAYRTVALGPHTDNPYRTPTPGIQLLHCLCNETSGGESTLVDALRCGRLLRERDPRAFDLLAQVPVRFCFDDDATSLAADRTVLDCDHTGQLQGIHYSPRLDWMPLMDEDTTRRYQHARKQLSGLLCDPANELRLRLESGDCLIMDNNRVLHGRTEFDPTEGTRHLQGCYIDRDGPAGLYRRLSATVANAGDGA